MACSRAKFNFDLPFFITFYYIFYLWLYLVLQIQWYFTFYFPWPPNQLTRQLSCADSFGQGGAARCLMFVLISSAHSYNTWEMRGSRCMDLSRISKKYIDSVKRVFFIYLLPNFFFALSVTHYVVCTSCFVFCTTKSAVFDYNHILNLSIKFPLLSLQDCTWHSSRLVHRFPSKGILSCLTYNISDHFILFINKLYRQITVNNSLLSETTIRAKYFSTY